MPGTFISYRRSDTEGYAGRLFEGLKARCGEDQLFFDVAGITAGEDFHQVIADKVGSCDVLLALIGQQWVNATDDQGRRRLDSRDDFVRLEIGAALKRGIVVIPVLLQGAGMPQPAELPEDLARLARLNALELRHTRWEADFAQLLETLGRHVRLRDGRKPTRRRWLRTGLAAAAVVAALFVVPPFTFPQVPAVVGLPLETAKAILLTQNWSFTIAEVDKTSAGTSHVLGQRPPGRDHVLVGTMVHLEVSRANPLLGEAQPAVPDATLEKVLVGTWWARHTALNTSFLDIRYTLLPGGRVNWQGNVTYGWQKIPLILSGTWQVKEGRLETVVDASNAPAIIANGYKGTAEIIDVTGEEFTYVDGADKKIYVDARVR